MLLMHDVFNKKTMEQIEDDNTIILTNEERDKVLEALNKAPEPNAVLKELLKSFKKRPTE